MWSIYFTTGDSRSLEGRTGFDFGHSVAAAAVAAAIAAIVEG